MTPDRDEPISAGEAHGISRRQFIGGLAAMAGAAAFIRPREFFGQLVDPSASGIEHIVLLMMENRSLDHFLGWLPGINGRQNGLTYLDSNGKRHPTFHLRDFQGCSHPDPDHSYTGGRIEYDGGLCDGWLRLNDEYSIGYYRQSDLDFLGPAAPAWTTFSNYYSAMMAETYPNRMYQHAGQTDRLANTLAISTLPTIWDSLAAANLTGRYYYSDVPFLALWGTKYIPISRIIAQFFADCAAGTLPHVSFVEPRFLGEIEGVSNDDHPHADIRNGEAFMNQVYTAVTQSPNWPNTVLIISYDEWGGFFDHVPPSAAAIPPASQRAGDEDGLRGFRVPCLLVAPWARRGFISDTLFDHTSVLRMIEWRFGLQPLTVRDGEANNLASVLNFAKPNLEAPNFQVPPGPFGGACPSAAAPIRTASTEPWGALLQQARANGWPG